ncbi:MAG TPA: hypothetical protein VLW49_00555 [Gaiellaceae bacterium]|nr:hypothetical protein [Gaiellaceae bacterium]
MPITTFVRLATRHRPVRFTSPPTTPIQRETFRREEGASGTSSVRRTSSACDCAR